MPHFAWRSRIDVAGFSETPLVASSRKFQTAWHTSELYLSGRVLHDKGIELEALPH